MYNLTYIRLTKPYKINPANDPEAPTLDAPVLKIVKYTSLDELSLSPYIEVIYGYGFVNSKNEFKLLDPLLRKEIITDINRDSENGKLLDVGTNQQTRQIEKAGTWLTDLLQIPDDQPNKTFGNFRTEDLYPYLVSKLGIDGEIVTS